MNGECKGRLAFSKEGVFRITFLLKERETSNTYSILYTNLFSWIRADLETYSARECIE